jgi:hypothetical protein
LVKIQEAENQVVADYQVTSDGPKIEPQIFGRFPHLSAVDRGFWSPANKQAAKPTWGQEGVHTGAGKTLGRTTRGATSTVVSPWPAAAGGVRGPYRRHETARDGLARCLYRGPDGIQRWVGWGVVSDNLWVLDDSKCPKRKQASSTPRLSKKMPKTFCTGN